MNNQDNNGTNIRREVKGRGLFYGVIAVATFIVMAVGATFAYFTATTSSTNTAVTAGSTTLQLEYISYETAWNNLDLIPADIRVVQWSFEKQNDTTLNSGGLNATKGNLLCKDDYGNSICSVYVFQVTNSAASPQTLSLSVVSKLNTFYNLHAIAYDLSVSTDNKTTYETLDPKYEDATEGSVTKGNGANDPDFKSVTVSENTGGEITVTDGSGKEITPGNFTPIYVNRNGVTKTLLSSVNAETKFAESAKLVTVLDDTLNESGNAVDRTAVVAENFTVGPNETKTFALVLFVNETEDDQTSLDAKKSFTGQVIVGPGDGKTGVSGFISAASESEEPEEDLSGDSESESTEGSEVTNP